MTTAQARDTVGKPTWHKVRLRGKVRRVKRVRDGIEFEVLLPRVAFKTFSPVWANKPKEKQ
jgi:hypothetical protein